MADVQKEINNRKPDFKAYVEPQKAKADIVIQVLNICIMSACIYSYIHIYTYIDIYRDIICIKNDA